MRDVNMRKVYDYVSSKMRQIIYEKTFTGGGTPIKYMFFPYQYSNELIVVFSSLTRKGVPARYNYVRTLKDIKKNKMFILDDSGPEHRGSYCLGRYGDSSVEQNTKDLISAYIKKYSITHTYYCGSSKGGWCALYFGLDDKNADIIVGANQYLLGNYFLCLPDIRLEQWILGENWCNDDIESLNSKLRDKIIARRENNNRIHIHVSDQEHTYKEHVKYMIEDLDKYGYFYDTEILHYQNHGDIVNYFPLYLKNVIMNMCQC